MKTVTIVYQTQTWSQNSKHVGRSVPNHHVIVKFVVKIVAVVSETPVPCPALPQSLPHNMHQQRAQQHQHHRPRRSSSQVATDTYLATSETLSNPQISISISPNPSPSPSIMAINPPSRPTAAAALPRRFFCSLSRS